MGMLFTHKLNHLGVIFHGKRFRFQLLAINKNRLCFIFNFKGVIMPFTIINRIFPADYHVRFVILAKSNKQYFFRKPNLTKKLVFNASPCNLTLFESNLDLRIIVLMSTIFCGKISISAIDFTCYLFCFFLTNLTLVNRRSTFSSKIYARLIVRNLSANFSGKQRLTYHV